MSLYYTHLMIATPATYCPAADRILAFLEALRREGVLASNATMSVATIDYCTGRVRQGMNPFTGERLSVPMPTRSRRPEQPVSSWGECVELLEGQSEYNVTISIPPQSGKPLLVFGHYRESSWEPLNPQPGMSMTCRVRRCPVHLAQARSVEEFSQPIDPQDCSPLFDEDCSGDENAGGVFVHPECGPRKLAQAGCTRFWVEFATGNLVFPRLTGDNLELLPPDFVSLAQTAFETDFVQASHWG